MQAQPMHIADPVRVADQPDHAPQQARRSDNHRSNRRKPAVSIGQFIRHIIPAPIRLFLSKIATGAALLLTLCAALALATWSVTDPSITYAAGGETSNWMGYWGASFADLTMQFIGLGSIALVGVVAGWCLYTLTGRHLPSRIARFTQFAIGLCLLTAALGCLAAPQGWPLFGAVGLGGVIGDAWLAIPRAFIGAYPSGPLAAVAAVCLAAPGLYLLARSTNIHRGVPSVEKVVAVPKHQPNRKSTTSTSSVSPTKTKAATGARSSRHPSAWPITSPTAPRPWSAPAHRTAMRNRAAVWPNRC